MNSGFNFRLQRVLDYREHLKKQKAGELTEYISHLEQEKNALSCLADTKNSLVDDMDSKCNEGIQVGYLVQCNKYIDQLNRFIDKQRENVSDIEKRVEECRENVVEASRNKEVIERLKARHYGRFSYHLSMEQEKEVEDLVNNRNISL
jgi:flagellar FliJ protein